MKHLNFFIIVFVLCVSVLFSLNTAFAQPWPSCNDPANEGAQCWPTSYWCRYNTTNPDGTCDGVESVTTYTNPVTGCDSVFYECSNIVLLGDEMEARGTCQDSSCAGGNTPTGNTCPIDSPGSSYVVDIFCPGDGGYNGGYPADPTPPDPRFTITVNPVERTVKWNENALYRISGHNEYDGDLTFSYTDCPVNANCYFAMDIPGMGLTPIGGSGLGFWAGDTSDDDFGTTGTPIYFVVTAPNTVPASTYAINPRFNFDIASNPNDKVEVRPVSFVLLGGGNNGSQCVSINAPDTVNANQNFTGVIQMRNSGTRTWDNIVTSADDGDHKLGSQTGQDNTRWGTNRVALAFANDQSVTQNEVVTFTYQFTAPSSPGNYPFDWKMVEEFVQWFGATCSKAGGITVIDLPNLNAGPTTQGAATVGTPQTFPATIYNNGTEPTGVGFVNVMRVNSATAAVANGGGGVVTGSAVANVPGSLADGANTLVNFSYNFPAAGTFAVQVCADNNASMVGTINEGAVNEGDNCSAWTDVGVNAMPSPTVTLSADPITGNSPLSSTLTWGVTGATACTRTSGPVAIPAWNSNTSFVNGSQLVGGLTPPATTFTLSCVNGSSAPNVQSVVVTPVISPPTVFLIGNSPGIGQAWLEYTITNATECTRTSNPGVIAWNNNSSFTTGNQTVNGLAGTTRFTLSCNNGGGVPTVRFVDITPDNDALLRVFKNGGGTVVGTGINCGADCDENFIVPVLPALPQSITLTATPSSSFWVFDKWQGDFCNNSTNPSCTVTMDNDHQMTAQFKPKPFIYREF